MDWWEGSDVWLRDSRLIVEEWRRLWQWMKERLLRSQDVNSTYHSMAEEQLPSVKHQKASGSARVVHLKRASWTL